MNKKILIAVAVILAVLIPVGAVGINAALSKPDESGGGYENTTIDRINYTIDNTDFTFDSSSTGDYQFSFTFTVSKAEADFYGRIDSFEITGMSYKSVVFEGQGGTPDGSFVDGLVLSAENGTPTEYSWLVTVVTDTVPESASVVFTYTSGLTKLTSETTEKVIPLNFAVQ